MKTLKKYGKTLGIFLICILVLSLIVSLFNIANILYTKGSDIMIMIGMVLIFGFIGLQFGRVATEKGYLEGLKIGGSLILVLIVINLLFYRTSFSLERFIYYVVLILSSTLGSMIGINKKK